MNRRDLFRLLTGAAVTPFAAFASDGVAINAIPHPTDAGLQSLFDGHQLDTARYTHRSYALGFAVSDIEREKTLTYRKLVDHAQAQLFAGRNI